MEVTDRFAKKVRSCAIGLARLPLLNADGQTDFPSRSSMNNVLPLPFSM
jgi:hypothetical protein